MKGATIVARGTKSRTLYTIAGCMNITAIAESASNSSLWHNRLGHVSVKGMKMLAAKGVLEGLKSIDVGRCENYVMSKQKRVSFTRTAREMKKVRLEMEPDVEHGSKTTKQMGVELELQENSLSDVVVDTHETPEITAEELDVEHSSKTMKQVGVEPELQENSFSDVVADSHETPETTAEEPDVEQGSKTTKQVGVELELQENSLSDVVADACETPETTAEEPDVEHSSKTTTKQVGVELELQENSLSDVVADTHETPKTTAEEPDVEQGSKTTKQVGVELKL